MKHLWFVFNLIFVITVVDAQESVKVEFKTSIHNFKEMLDGKNYELFLHQNTYLYDLENPIETNTQHIIKNSEYFYYQSNEITSISLIDLRVVVDSSIKTIYITNNVENLNPINFLFDDSLLNKVPIEKKELKEFLIYHIDMYGTNMGVESVQYHFEKKSKTLKRILIFLQEGEYYEDQDHLNEKQSPIQEIILEIINHKNPNLPSLDDFILKRKNEYIVAPKYTTYILKDIREK